MCGGRPARSKAALIATQMGIDAGTNSVQKHFVDDFGNKGGDSYSSVVARQREVTFFRDRNGVECGELLGGPHQRVDR